MTLEQHDIDYPCPSCESTDTVMVYEDIYALGHAQIVETVRRGGICTECGLGFWTPDLKDVDPREDTND